MHTKERRWKVTGGRKHHKRAGREASEEANLADNLANLANTLIWDSILTDCVSDLQNSEAIHVCHLRYTACSPLLRQA